MTEQITEQTAEQLSQPAGDPARRKQKLTKSKASEYFFIFCFTIIPVIHFLVMYVYVNLNSFVMAFQITENDTMRWTLEHFSRFWIELRDGGAELNQAFMNTFKTFGINCVMFVIGVFVSYFLYKKIWGHSVFRVLFFLPSILSAVVIANVYKSIISTEAFETFLQKLCGLDYLPEPLAQIEFANTFVFIHMIWLGFPGNMVIWSGTFARIPDSVVESAKLDGVNWVQELFLVILPMVWSTFGLMLTLTLCGLFSASGAVFLLTQGNWGTQTFSNWTYMQVYGSQGSPSNNALNYLSAVGLCTTVVATAIALTTRYVAGKVFEDVTY